MATLAFAVPGKPVAKERPRTVSLRDGHGRRRVRTYTPKKTAEYEQRVAWAARSALRSRQMAGPFTVSLTYYLPTRRRVDIDIWSNQDLMASTASYGTTTARSSS